MAAKTIPIQDYIYYNRKLIDQTLETIISGDNKAVEAARYSLLSPGRRWRPILTLTLAEEFSSPYLEMPKLACASECVHAASLILDDLPCMDNADLRRGKETCHKKYGEDIATLAAITLLETSWGTMNEYSPNKYRKMLLSEAYRVGKIMIHGQVSDLKEISNNKIKLINRYIGKTGGLFSLATIAGMFYYNKWKLNTMKDFGNAIGIAYQITDDLKDKLSEKETGKDSNQDKNKITMVSLLGEERARKEAIKLKKRVISTIKGKEQLENLLDEMIKIPGEF